MDSIRNQIKGKGVWFWAAVSVLLIVTVLFSTQAFSASMTVTADPLNDGSTTYPSVFEADWNTKNVQAHKLTANLSGTTVTTVTASGVASQGGRNLKIQLLNSSATVISEGCQDTGGGTFSGVVVDVAPDVTYSSVYRVKAIGLKNC